MKIELSREEANLLLKAIGTLIKYIQVERLPYLTTKEFIEEEKAEITRLNILKVEIQRKRAKSKD